MKSFNIPFIGGLVQLTPEQVDDALYWIEEQKLITPQLPCACDSIVCDSPMIDINIHHWFRSLSKEQQDNLNKTLVGYCPIKLDMFYYNFN